MRPAKIIKNKELQQIKKEYDETIELFSSLNINHVQNNGKQKLLLEKEQQILKIVNEKIG